MRRVRAAWSCLGLLLAGTAGAQSPVLVVGEVPGPGVDFTDIQQAIDAAVGGEIVLVHAGTYAPFTIQAKALTVVADGPVLIPGGLVVQSLLPEQPVVLRGLQAEPEVKPGLAVDGCAGAVWVEACTLRGGQEGGAPGGLEAADAHGLTLVRSQVTGGKYGNPTFGFTNVSGVTALVLSASRAAAWDTTCTGTPGGVEAQDNGGYGGSGVFTKLGTHLCATGGLFEGGDGGYGLEEFDFLCGCSFCHPGGTGGAGLVTLTSSLVELRDVQLVAGEGMQDPSSSCQGHDGVPLGGATDDVTLLEGTSRALTLPAAVREGDPLEVHIQGEPGDATVVLAAWEADFFELAFGTLSLQPQVVALLGTLPASGELTLQVTAPELGPGVEGLLLVAQPWFQPAVGSKLLGAPSATVLLDAQF